MTWNLLGTDDGFAGTDDGLQGFRRRNTRLDGVFQLEGRSRSRGLGFDMSRSGRRGRRGRHGRHGRRGRTLGEFRRLRQPQSGLKGRSLTQLEGLKGAHKRPVNELCSLGLRNIYMYIFTWARG